MPSTASKSYYHCIHIHLQGNQPLEIACSKPVARPPNWLLWPYVDMAPLYICSTAVSLGHRTQPSLCTGQILLLYWTRYK